MWFKIKIRLLLMKTMLEASVLVTTKCHRALIFLLIWWSGYCGKSCNKQNNAMVNIIVK